jgi:hypothetical protein
VRIAMDSPGDGALGNAEAVRQHPVSRAAQRLVSELVYVLWAQPASTRLACANHPHTTAGHLS